MSIVITGAGGFLGWHTAVRLRSVHGIEPVRIGRTAFGRAETLAAALADAEAVIHLAGVNRAATADAVEHGNIVIAEALADALRGCRRSVTVVYGNSVQADLDNPYGRGKSRSAQVIDAVVTELGGRFVDVRLPNIFGEHGRPRYNSFVATFCDEVASGGEPRVDEDRTIPLLHAQDAAEALIAAALAPGRSPVTPVAAAHSVSEVLGRLREYEQVYRHGEIPALPDKFAVDLFNTYRSFLFPERYPFHPQVHVDERGSLFETVRAHGGAGMTFLSTTRPGRTRGDHYHLSKIERFAVVAGDAEIALRRVYDDRVVRFRLSGDRPGFVDMPTMWVHNIKNVGASELVTAFWADQLLDPERPDQYAEEVGNGGGEP